MNKISIFFILILLNSILFATASNSVHKNPFNEILYGIYGEEQAQEIISNNKIECPACTLGMNHSQKKYLFFKVLGVVEGLSIVNVEKVDKVLEKLCNILPFVWNILI